MDLNKIILKVLNNEATKEEYAILESWKKESEDNIAILEDIRRGDSEVNLPYTDYDSESAWSKVEPQLESPSGSYWRYALIAGLLLLAVIAYVAFDNYNENRLKDYRTDDKIEHIVLRDDSKVWINEQSSLREVTDFQGEERKVALAGEAYFDVEHKEAIPFIIDLGGDRHIKVIGTSFNVINVEEDFDLAVYSGMVELHVLDRVIEVPKGQRVKLVNGSYVKLKNKSQNLISWKTRNLVFDNTPLSKVLQDISRHYDVTFDKKEGVKMAQCRLRSKFSDERIEDVLAELKTVFDMQYVYTPDNRNIQIESLKCN